MDECVCVKKRGMREITTSDNYSPLRLITYFYTFFLMYQKAIHRAQGVPWGEEALTGGADSNAGSWPLEVGITCDKCLLIYLLYVNIQKKEAYIFYSLRQHLNPRKLCHTPEPYPGKAFLLPWWYLCQSYTATRDFPLLGFPLLPIMPAPVL